MDDDTTTKDDQYLTDVLSYSVDRLAKVRFFFLSSSFQFVFTSSSSSSLSVSFLFHFTIDLQIQSGFGDVNASREYERARLLSRCVYISKTALNLEIDCEMEKERDR